MRGEHRTIGPVSGRDRSAGDGPGLRAMFGRLTGETSYQRFHAPYPRVPEPMLAHLMGHGGGRSLVAVAEGGVLGHALYAGGSGCEAGVALVVEDGWQPRGTGKPLLSGLARKATGRGLESFTAEGHGGNHRVLSPADSVFAGARHTPMGGSYEMFMPMRGLRPATEPGQKIRPAA